MKKLMTATLVLTAFVSGALSLSAFANNELKQLGRDMKTNTRSNVEEAKKSNQEIIDNRKKAAEETSKQREADNKAKIEHYKTMQKQEKAKNDAALKAKKEELAQIKKNKQNLPEAQRKAKEDALQKQIDSLDAKNQSSMDNYNKKIEALKAQ